MRRLLPRRGAPEPVPTVADVAAAMDLLALALRGGRGVTECLDVVAAALPGALASPLRQVAAARAWGLDDEEAWSACGPAWHATRRALQLAAEAGVPPADLLVRAAADLRREEEARLAEADGRLAVRVVVPLGLLFLPAFMLTTVVPVVVALARQLLQR